VTYSQKGTALDQAARERWIEWIESLELRERIALSSSDLTPFEQAQVAVWKGDYSEDEVGLRVLAEAGDAPAQELLARLYIEGWGVTRDYDRARDWFERAAEKNPQAAFNLGRMYETGLGVEVDLAEAYRWYRSAAERGDAEAEGKVGFMLAEGVQVERDRQEAYRWFERSAAQGYDHARFWLGKLVAEGALGEPDWEQARAWYEAVARDGEFEAQYELGVLCADGQSPACGESEAKLWLMRATMQGHDAARQFYLKLFGRPGSQEKSG